MMIELEDGSYVNSDAIRSMKQKTGGWGSMLTLQENDGGERNYIGGDTPSEIADMINLTIIKADPGYVLLIVDDISEVEFNFGRETIIAWKIYPDRHGWPRPITITSGDRQLSNLQYILCPNGTVAHQDRCTYENLEEWELEARKEWTAAKEREARAKLRVVKEST